MVGRLIPDVVLGTHVDDVGDDLVEVWCRADVAQDAQERLLLRLDRHVQAVVGEVVHRAQAAQLVVAHVAVVLQDDALENLRRRDVDEVNAEERAHDVLEVHALRQHLRLAHAFDEQLQAHVVFELVPVGL